MLTPRMLVLLAGVLFATGGAALKLAPGLPALDVAGLRSGIAGIILLVLVPQTRIRPNAWTFAVGLPYAATLVLFAVATRLTTAANAVFLQSTAPVWLTILGPLCLREPVRARDFGVLSLLGIGATLFFVAGDTASDIAMNPALGNLLAGCSGLTWALTILGLRALARRGASATSAAVVGNGIALMVALPFLHFERLGTAGATDWMALAYLGVFQVGIAYVLLTRAVQHVPALDATLLLMIEPALNPVFTFMVHGERPALLAILGGGIVIMALLLKAVLDARAVRAGYRRGTPLGGPSQIIGAESRAAP